MRIERNAAELPVSTSKKEWILQWQETAKDMTAHHKFFETHAHYNLEQYKGLRDKLLNDMHNAGIDKCIIPSVEAFKRDGQGNLIDCNQEIRQMFEEYNWIWYAFASHPKYLWKDPVWNEDRWKAFERMLQDEKCIAVGETGLDYSYPSFNAQHQRMQEDYFIRFITLANEYKLPVILHIRPRTSEDQQADVFDVHSDVFRILEKHPIENGAVCHCFGGSAALMRQYIEHGVNYFGIGGRILKGEPELGEAVKAMPETSILLETDAPYINTVPGISGPNTSFALLPIAQKIARIRKTEVDYIIDIAYKNAERLFSVGSK